MYSMAEETKFFFHQPPITSPATSEYPSVEEFSGEFSFDMELGQCGVGEHNKRQSTWQHSKLLKKVFIMEGRSLPLKFRMKIPPNETEQFGYYVRAVAVYMDADSLNLPVLRCLNHAQYNSDALYKDYEYVDHVVSSSHRNAIYEVDPYTQRRSVVVPLPAPQAGSEWQTIMFAMMCRSSCSGGINRRPIALVFTLENLYNVLGRKVLSVRVCASPQRDRLLDESRTLKKESNSEPSVIGRYIIPVPFGDDYVTLLKEARELAIKDMPDGQEKLNEIMRLDQCIMAATTKMMQYMGNMPYPIIQENNQIFGWEHYLSNLPYQQHLASNTFNSMETLRFYFVTWNVATQPPEENLSLMLGLTRDRLPDFYVIGLQEVKAQPQNLLFDALFDDPWLNHFRDALLVKDFVRVRTIRLQGLLLVVYCQRKHLLQIRDIDTQYTRTGLGGMWGNKGAVSVRMAVSGVSMCLVNCHFTAHDHLKEERIAEYNTVLHSHTYQAKETSHILFHDYVFWLGDLNFRTRTGIAEELNSDEIATLIKRGELTRLLEHDELKHVMLNGEAFAELSEPTVTFPPTYKFNSRTDIYDLRRRPSWTDRILYKVTSFVYENVTLEAEPVSYKSWNDYIQSDHKPVTAEYKVKVFKDHHDRVVEFHPIQQWFLEEENIVSFTCSSDVDPSAGNDWIGIYRENFSSLEDYVFYVYAPRVPTTSGQVHIAFPDGAIALPGTYRLLYLTQNSASVYGMSSPFTAIQRDGSNTNQYQVRQRF